MRRIPAEIGCMAARIDHVVLWVEDPQRSLDFYQRVLGFEGLRVSEFARGEVPFVSVRVSEDSIIDLMSRDLAPSVDAMFESRGSAGNRINHVCLAMNREEFEELRVGLTEYGVPVSDIKANLYGARGAAPESFYFQDIDGNVVEARHDERGD